ncbi:MAG: Mu transposase C-terminal domain-containing protein [Syntrophomonas sp.]
MDSFLAESALEKPQTLESLNQLFGVWLEECYQHKPHSALEKNLSPATAYRSDRKALKFLDPELVASAFLHCEARKVDKAGCISFNGRKFEAGLSFIGCKVDVIYDPADLDELTIEYGGHKPFKAKPLVIGERSGKRPKLPEHLLPASAQSSRLLKAAARKNQERKADQIPAVSYRSVRKEGKGNV